MKQEILKTNRAKLLSDFINEMKLSIKKHNIKEKYLIKLISIQELQIIPIMQKSVSENF